MNFEWYVNLINFLNNRAKENNPLTRIEIIQLNNCIIRYDIADSIIELIHEIADANECGDCNSWNELIAMLH